MKHANLWHTKLAAHCSAHATQALWLNPSAPAGTSPDPAASVDHVHAAVHTAVRALLPPEPLQALLERAQRYAAAADHPRWPAPSGPLPAAAPAAPHPAAQTAAHWAQLDWSQQPLLIHPLTGALLDLGQTLGLSASALAHLQPRAQAHWSALLQRALGTQEASPSTLSAEQAQRLLLAWWRFGPELQGSAHGSNRGSAGTPDALAALWGLLPADARVPDHALWDQLDLASAFAGAFAADPDGQAALLTVSLGPVQSFIAAARSTSDLWAGSHLLARLSWEAMRTVCERLGPDAIVFPRLRGIPQVDVWLRDQMQLPRELFERCDWQRSAASDSNPLFAAALPNRFVALVPRSQARTLALAAQDAARQWLQQQGREVVADLLRAIKAEPDAHPTPFAQMQQQLQGFPEVHWAAVPFDLVQQRPAPPQAQADAQARPQAHQAQAEPALDTLQLSAAMAPFFGVAPGQPCGFLASPVWQRLQRHSGAVSFFVCHPGVLYPAIYDLAERALAAAKATRSFDAMPQHGWRCSLSGEVEWLTLERNHLEHPYRQRTDTLWARLARAKPSWVRRGEHLGALSAIKRLWPVRFAAEAAQALGRSEVMRFVVSTHTMALAGQIEHWLDASAKGSPATALDPDRAARREAALVAAQRAYPVALPRRLARSYGARPEYELARRLPGLLEASADTEADTEADTSAAADAPAAANSAERARRQVQSILGVQGLESYFGLLLFDGDHMGKILSGDPAHAISYRDSFHPQLHAGFDAWARNHPELRALADTKRALAPNRHQTISGALNDFALHVVPHVVEQEHLGRLIYAGGDDVLAMLPTADLLKAMQRLRQAYSGTANGTPAPDWSQPPARDQLLCHGGFAYLNGRLMRLMGARATASCGAVVAHHQAPLAALLRELHRAEQRAKKEGGRDAFSLTLIKRSGGTLRLTAKWGEPLLALNDLHDFLARSDVSRRAAYHTLEWLRDLPEPAGSNAPMLERMLAYQLERQSDGAAKALAPALAQCLTKLTLRQPAQPKPSQPQPRKAWLDNFIRVAEFLARDARHPGAAAGERT